MAWPIVIADDIADRWRPLTDAETTVATARIDDAGAQLRTALRLRGILTSPTFATEPERADWEQRYVSTISDAVARYLKNTDGWSEEREQIDDWSLTRRRARDAEEGALFISDAEADALVPRVKRRTGAFSIRLGRS